MLNKVDRNKNPFQVPENYFENFNTEIMSKLPEKQVEKAKIVPLWKKVLPWTAVAAVFCGVIFSTGILKNNTSSEPAPSVSTALASSEEEDYYLFLEDEVVKSRYRDMMYNN